jgi:hypothetical protein
MGYSRLAFARSAIQEGNYTAIRCGVRGKLVSAKDGEILTVGELRAYLDGQPADTPVVVHVNVDGLYMRISSGLSATVATGTTDAEFVVEIGWEPAS